MDLFKINIIDSDVISKLGYLPKSIQSLEQKVLKELADSATNSFKSSVPIDTGELRLDINIGQLEAKTATVIVEEIPHYGRRKEVKQAPDLAKALQAGQGKRSRASFAIPPYPSRGGPTAGWIDQAQEDFINQAKNVINESGTP